MQPDEYAYLKPGTVLRHIHDRTLVTLAHETIAPGWWLTDGRFLVEWHLKQSYQVERSEPYGELTVQAVDVLEGDRLGWVHGVKITEVRGQMLDVPCFVTEDGGQHYYSAEALVKINRPYKPADPDVTITLKRSVVDYMAVQVGGRLSDREKADSGAWAQVFRACRDAQ